MIKLVRHFFIFRLAKNSDKENTVGDVRLYKWKRLCNRCFRFICWKNKFDFQQLILSFLRRLSVVFLKGEFESLRWNFYRKIHLSKTMPAYQ